MPQQIDLNEYEATTVKTSIQYRNAELHVRAMPEGDKKVYEFVCSSEAPLENRWMWAENQERYVYGTEILLHGAENVDMSWIASGNAPFLKDHDTDDQCGVVVGAVLEDRKLKVTDLKFSRSQDAVDLRNDIDDGIRQNVSVGYVIMELIEVQPPVRDKPGIYHATRWKPYEVSSVAIPADDLVGFGRAKQAGMFETICYRKKELNKNNTMELTEPTAPVVVREVESDFSRMQQVAELMSDKFPEGREVAARAISENKTFEEFNTEYQKLMREAQSKHPKKDYAIGLTPQEANNFRFTKFFAHVANPHDKRIAEEAAFEIEVSQAAAQRQNSAPKGMVIPVDILRAPFLPAMSKRELTATGDGQYLIQTNVLTGSFIDFLDAQTRVIQAGATVLRDLTGSVSIPRRDAEMVGGWVAESGDTGEKTPSYDAVTLTEKTYGMHVKISRQMRKQTSMDIEAMVRRDMVTGMALGIDRGALYGAGSSNEPKGVMLQTGINSVTLAANNAPTYGNIIDMETAITEDNALIDGATLKWIIHPTLVGTLKKTAVASSTDSRMIIDKDEKGLIGYERLASTNAILSSVKRMILGNWADLLIGFWGGLDVIVDPYSSSSDGTLKLVIMQDCDVAVRHPESFCICANPT